MMDKSTLKNIFNKKNSEFFAKYGNYSDQDYNEKYIEEYGNMLKEIMILSGDEKLIEFAKGFDLRKTVGFKSKNDQQKIEFAELVSQALKEIFLTF